MAWSAPAGPDTADYMHRLAGEVVDDLTSMGWEPDPHGVTATGVMSASSIGDWREAVHKWVEPPTSDEELVAISIVCDARTIYGPDRGLDVPSLIRDVRPQPALLRMLLRSALATKPPTGFLRDIVVEHSGEHKGHFDVKHGGLLPIVNIARYAALATRAMTTSTSERLRAAAEAGTLTATDAATLGEAFDFISDLRLEHQIRRAPSGELARRPDRSEDAQLSHAPLPSRHVPGRCLGAEVAERQARLEHLTVRGEPGARSILSAYDRTPMPAADTPWREADLCVVDLETTGLDAASDEIIAFATVPIAGARVCMREARYRVVCPRRMPRANTIVIHGLRSEELADAPSLSEVMDELLAELTGRVLVAHVATVEERFLGRALLEAGTSLRNPVIDTAGLAAELFSRRRQPGRAGGRADTARAEARPAGSPPARGRWRCPDRRPGIPRPGDRARRVRAPDGRLAGRVAPPPRTLGGAAPGTAAHTRAASAVASELRGALHERPPPRVLAGGATPRPCAARSARPRESARRCRASSAQHPAPTAPSAAAPAAVASSEPALDRHARRVGLQPQQEVGSRVSPPSTRRTSRGRRAARRRPGCRPRATRSRRGRPGRRGRDASRRSSPRRVRGRRTATRRPEAGECREHADAAGVLDARPQAPRARAGPPPGRGRRSATPAAPRQ